MLDTLAHFLVKHRKYFVIASFLMVGASLYGVTKIQLNGDFRHMFSSENVDLNLLDEIENTYLQADQVMVLMKYPHGDAFTIENLRHTKALTAKLWQSPYSIHVESLTTTNRSHSSDDTFFIEELIPDPESLNPDKLESIREYVRNDDYISKGLVSEDFQVVSIVINLALPDDPQLRIPAIQEHVDFLEKIITDAKANKPGIIIHYMGGPVLEISMIDVVKSDIMTLMPICFLVCFFILGFLLRSGISVFGTLFTIVMSVAMTLGLSGWMGFSFSPTSAMAPVMVILLAMADSVHLLTQYIIEYRKGYPKLEAMERSISLNFKPILLTSVTTAIGFLGMNMSDSPAFHDFGNVTSIGVLIAFLLTLTLTPGVMLWLPINAEQKPLPLSQLMTTFSRFAIAHQRRLFLIVLFIVPVLFAFIPTLEINDDVIEYLGDDVPFKKTVTFANEHLSGFQYLLYSLDSGESGHVNDPVFLNHADEFQRWLRQQENVVNVFSYADISKKLNMAMHDDDPSWKTVPESRELAAQYMLLYEMALPAGENISRDLDNARSSLRVMVALNTMPNQELVQLDARAQAWLTEHAPALATQGASRSLMFANLGGIIMKSMISGSIIALVLINIVIIIGIRSLRYGLICLIPNIIPAVVVYGLWAVLIGHVNQTACIVFSISIGLVVDDTVHFMTKYLKGRGEGLTPEDSIEYAFSTAGVALFVTTVALTLGMSANFFSSFIPNMTTAAMLMGIISMALLLDLFFLPALLLHYERWYQRYFGTQHSRGYREQTS